MGEAMIKINNKFAIGCLVQWYEIELVSSYLESVKRAVSCIDNKKNVIIDLYLNTSQVLEKIDENEMSISDVKGKYDQIIKDIFEYESRPLLYYWVQDGVVNVSS